MGRKTTGLFVARLPDFFIFSGKFLRNIGYETGVN